MGTCAFQATKAILYVIRKQLQQCWKKKRNAWLIPTKIGSYVAAHSTQTCAGSHHSQVSQIGTTRRTDLPIAGCSPLNEFDPAILHEPLLDLLVPFAQSPPLIRAVLLALTVPGKNPNMRAQTIDMACRQLRSRVTIELLFDVYPSHLSAVHVETVKSNRFDWDCGKLLKYRDTAWFILPWVRPMLP